MGKAVVILFGIVIVCSFLLTALYYIGIVVIIGITIFGVFGLAEKHMECETIKHGIDREYNCRMFEIDKQYELKNKQLELTHNQPDKKSNQSRYIDVS